MPEYSIGEIARRAGLQPSALRYYESIGLLPEAGRVNGGRRYDESILQRLAVIQLAKRAGFTVAEIQTLVHGFTPDTPAGARWRTLAREKLLELDGVIERAQQMKHFLEGGLHCNCLRLEDCVTKWEAKSNR